MREKILEILADAEEDILTYEGDNMMEDGIINSFAVIELVSDLEDAFDIDIVEKHHNRKLDAPSGTAKMLLAAADESDAYEHVFGRDGNRKRGREIGVHAVRGGTIAGEHTVIYAGEDEILEIKHTAGSKKIFASGALKAAGFTADAEPGLYSMEDVLFG